MKNLKFVLTPKNHSIIHKLAKLGNAVVLDWYIKQLKNIIKLETELLPKLFNEKSKLTKMIQQLDKEGHTPLYLACMQGASERDILAAEKAAKEKDVKDHLETDRLKKICESRVKCVQILLDEGG